MIPTKATPISYIRHNFTQFVLMAGLFALRSCSARIQTEEQVFESQPAVFGKRFNKNEGYKANLRYFESNMLLCGLPGDNQRRQATEGMHGKSVDPEQSPTASSSSSVDDIWFPKNDLPIALLVERGGCSFELKARTAMKIPAVKFMIVFDNEPNATRLVPMSASDGRGVELGLLFVSYKSGHELFSMTDAALRNSTATDRQEVIIEMDGEPAENTRTSTTQELMLAGMSLFFTFMACLGCILVCIQAGIVPTTGDDGRRLVLFARLAQSPGSRLMTEEQVKRLPVHKYCKETNIDDDDDDDDGNQDVETGSNSQPACAICIEEFKDGEKLRRLPCGHDFHTDCIVPWLTERQARCPLCKQDVIEEDEEGDDTPSNSWCLGRFSSSWLLLHGGNPLLRPGESPEDAGSITDDGDNGDESTIPDDINVDEDTDDDGDDDELAE